MMNNSFLDFINQKVQVPVSGLIAWFIGAFYWGKMVAQYRRRKEDEQREIDNFLTEEDE